MSHGNVASKSFSEITRRQIETEYSSHHLLRVHVVSPVHNEVSQ